MAKMKEVLVRLKQYFTKLGNDKADKVVNGTENNIVLLDANGNIKDSGKSLADTGKIDSVSIHGTPVQPDANKNVDLPAYPTRVSLLINNVDNTSDANKPVSTAQQAAIDSTGHKIDLEINNTNFKMKAKLYDKDNNLISTSTEIDLPLESVVVSGTYDNVTKKVILTLQNGTTIDFSVADLVYGLQSEITANNPLSSDLVSDTGNTHKFVSASEKAQITTNQQAIAGIKDGQNIDSFADVETALGGKQATINDLETIRSGASAGATAYQQPSGGIPKTDLSSDVQTSLNKADTSLQSHQDISGKEDKSNKVKSTDNSGAGWNTTTSDDKYPSEKLVKGSLDNKVDKVSGKGLSTNDYTTTEKNKLAGIEAGAEVNDVNSVNSKTGTVVLDTDDISDTNKTHKFVNAEEKSTWNGKQNALVSGINIKTINGNSILGSGDLTISGGGVSETKEIVSLRPIMTPLVIKATPQINFGGLPQNFYLKHFWTDGENIYYSKDTSQYILDKATSTWIEKTWYGLTRFDATGIWTDGENIYYSNGETQYVLDVSTSTWTTKTWTGMSNFNGLYIWSDGSNIYYSTGASLGIKQYVLDVSTSTWTTKTWTGITELWGTSVWTDGENIYYSNGETQKQLVNGEWINKTWTGLGEEGYLDADGIGFIENNILYVVEENYIYILDKSTSNWKHIQINDFVDTSGGYSLWSDGVNIYINDGDSLNYRLEVIKKRGYLV